jgi:uncharacterized protein
MDKHGPVVWVLRGKRAGDTAQAVDLALVLAQRTGVRIVEKQLHFNRFAAAPNWLMGAGFGTLVDEVRPQLQPPWPELVIAAGRKTARVSLAIKAASGGRTRLVQIGRPRLALSRFDLVLTTPQYGMPPLHNVVELPLPFAMAKPVAAEEQRRFSGLWQHLPRPWIVGVIGAAKFPVHLGARELDGFAAHLSRLAKRVNGSVILIDSPRSAVDALQRIATGVTVPQWLWRRGREANPYQAALRLADMFAVTSDSVSMVAEMLGTHKPVYVYRLPVSAWGLRWSAKSGLPSALARAGLLSPPRDVETFMTTLYAKGWIGDLQSGEGPRQAADIDAPFDAAVARIAGLISA